MIETEKQSRDYSTKVYSSLRTRERLYVKACGYTPLRTGGHRDLLDINSSWFSINFIQPELPRFPRATVSVLEPTGSRLRLPLNSSLFSLYAKLIGELMFIAINTQPLIAQPVNALARFMTDANAELYVLAKGVWIYAFTYRRS